MKRLMTDYGLNEKLAKQVLDSEYSRLFEVIVGESVVSSTTVAATLTETLKALKRDGVAVENVSDGQLRGLFKHVGDSGLVKEAIPDVLGWLAKNENGTVAQAVEKLGLGTLGSEELERIVDDVVRGNQKLVEERGADAFGALMGIVMGKVRGKARAEVVSDLLRKRLEHAES
jgi:glutamyl-tRNA(Gln) amidotransferase subunit E